MMASQYGYEDCCMSEILKMATAFEQRSKEQAENTEKAVKSAFEKHESALIQALSESEKRTNAAIHAQSQRLKQTALRSWMAVAIPVIVTLTLSAGAIIGMTWYMNSQIEQIATHKATLERLAEEGAEIQLDYCGDNRRLCVQIDESAPAYKGGYRILENY
jgi:hypothetical protein